MCRRTEEGIWPTVGLPRHRHFVGFFNVPVLAPTRDQPFYTAIPKANTSDKETSFLDLNIKVIGSDIHTSVYDKRDDFGFPIVNFPWLSGDVPRLPSYGIYISQLVRFARCCTSVLDFHSKNLKITSKLLTQGYRYHKLRKTFGKFFRSYSELLSKFGDISFQE